MTLLAWLRGEQHKPLTGTLQDGTHALRALADRLGNLTASAGRTPAAKTER